MIRIKLIFLFFCVRASLYLFLGPHSLTHTLFFYHTNNINHISKQLTTKILSFGEQPIFHLSKLARFQSGQTPTQI